MKRDYIVSLSTLTLAVIIYFICHSYFKADDSAFMQMAFIGCASISTMIFLFMKVNEWNLSSQNRDYESKLKNICEQLNNIQTDFAKVFRDNYKVYCDALNHLRETEKRVSRVITTYQDAIMYQAYLSGLGILRNKDKKNAERKIKEAKQCIADIEKEPDFCRTEYLNKHIFAKKEFENLLTSFKNQIPPRIYHKDCGKEINCPHCEIPIIKGDFDYIE
jgi:hypothetical protein